MSRRLGGLPLALEQAGAYVAYSPRRSFAAYLTLLDDYGLDPFAQGRPLDYQATATTTWQVSIDAAARTAPLAPKIMAVFAYLAPAPIPTACFVDLAAHPYLDAAPTTVAAAIDELNAYSLITIEHGSPLACTAWSETPPPAASAIPPPPASPSTPSATSIPRMSDGPTPGRPPPPCCPTCSTSPPPPPMIPTWQPRSSGCSTTPARPSTTPGAPPRQSHILEQAANLALDLHGADHPDTLTSRNNLAAAYRACRAHRRGRRPERGHPGRKAAGPRPRPPRHPHQPQQPRRRLPDAGRTADAIALHEATLAARQRVLGPDHPDTLTSRNNLAAAYSTPGAHAEAARPERGEPGRPANEFSAPTTPTPSPAATTSPPTYRDAGRTAEAIALRRGHLADRQRVLGPDHPDTLTSRNNLATPTWPPGAPPRPLTLTRRPCARQASPRPRPPRHPHQPQQPRRRLLGRRPPRRGRSRCTRPPSPHGKRMLGPDHPDTLTSRNNLAANYRTLGRAEIRTPRGEKGG